MSFDITKRKILYVSDHYAENVFGTKRSLFTELEKRGAKLQFFSAHSAGSNKIKGVELLHKLSEGFTDLWCAHTWVQIIGITKADLVQRGVKVLGFGFSDPYAWNGSKLAWYDAYASNHYGLHKKLSSRIPCTYFPTACDTRFHKDLMQPRKIDIIMFGVGVHNRFKPRSYRIDMMKSILHHFPKKIIRIYGDRWGTLPHSKRIQGKAFLNAINYSKLSLDLQQDHAPLAHRMFESMACGCPAITKNRPEVKVLLNAKQHDILTYDTTNGLIKTIEFYLSNEDKRKELAAQMRLNTIANHNMSNRVDNLLSWLDIIGF